jgi:hypothetical protein
LILALECAAISRKDCILVVVGFSSLNEMLITLGFGVSQVSKRDQSRLSFRRFAQSKTVLFTGVITISILKTEKFISGTKMCVIINIMAMWLCLKIVWCFLLNSFMVQVFKSKTQLFYRCSKSEKFPLNINDVLVSDRTLESEAVSLNFVMGAQVRNVEIRWVTLWGWILINN